MRSKEIIIAEVNGKCSNLQIIKRNNLITKMCEAWVEFTYPRDKAKETYTVGEVMNFVLDFILEDK